MLNQFVIVGRLVETPESNENEKRVVITLAIPRSYKNKDGGYDTDFISCVLWNGIASNTAEYCKKGDLLGVKGRLTSNKDKMEAVAEKITFLSNNNNK
jgi:single-strand DNA-binding protein